MLNHCGLVTPHHDNRSGSTLVQVMAWCFMAPSHYLNRCWLITSKVFWHSSKGKWQEILKISILDIDGLVQERCNSIANALELHLSCTNPSIRVWKLVWHCSSYATSWCSPLTLSFLSSSSMISTNWVTLWTACNHQTPIKSPSVWP